jgi:sugar O-acyltransferase (sialic acid O-acetyltransferase NeuD family)
MTSLVLIGGGGHCRSCIDVIESTTSYEVFGIVGEIDGEKMPVLGYPVLGTDEALVGLLQDCPMALITVGQIKTPELRKRLYHLVQDLGGSFPVVVSPQAYVSRRAEVGVGTIVMHGATLNVGVSVGINCIINSQALVEHDAEIGSHSHVSTGARVNGGASIGEGTFLGSGAVVNQGITVGNNCIIASGAVIRSDVPEGTQVRGEWQ